MTNDLKNYLKQNKQIEKVYLNEDGEWQFHKRAGYDIELTRDEVLEMNIASETPDATTKADIAISTEPGKVTGEENKADEKSGKGGKA